MDIAHMTVAQIARFWSKVTKTSTCWIWNAARTKAGYGMTAIWHAGRSESALSHRVSYELIVGMIPAGIELDHTCHNPACVNPEHLRPATRKQNMENRAGAQRNSRSGVRGVHWLNAISKWRAVVKHDGRQYFVGHYGSIADAEAAVTARRLELFTHNDMDRIAS